MFTSEQVANAEGLLVSADSWCNFFTRKKTGKSPYDLNYSVEVKNLINFIEFAE
jgi:hypothetical protein